MFQEQKEFAPKSGWFPRLPWHSVCLFLARSKEVSSTPREKADEASAHHPHRCRSVSNAARAVEFGRKRKTGQSRCRGNNKVALPRAPQCRLGTLPFTYPFPFGAVRPVIHRRHCVWGITSKISADSPPISNFTSVRYVFRLSPEMFKRLASSGM